MTNPVPLAVLALVGDPRGRPAEHWFEEELSIAELEETVASINRAIRASRR